MGGAQAHKKGLRVASRDRLVKPIRSRMAARKSVIA